MISEIDLLMTRMLTAFSWLKPFPLFLASKRNKRKCGLILSELADNLQLHQQQQQHASVSAQANKA
jgi:hypothetical protein